MAKSKLISSPDELYRLFVDYKTFIKSDPKLVTDWVGKDAEKVQRPKEKPLTMEGFENYVADLPGMPMSLDQYFSNKEGRYVKYVAICSRIRRIIRQDQIEGGMAGVYNPSITQRLNNLAEKTVSTVEITDDEIDYDQLSDAALEEILKAKRK